MQHPPVLQSTASELASNNAHNARQNTKETADDLEFWF